MKNNSIYINLFDENYNFPNLNISSRKLPKEIFNYFNLEIENIKNNFNKQKKHNDHLAGNIEKEYNIKHCLNNFEVNKFLLQSAIDYTTRFNLTPQILDNNLPFIIHDLWINFQKKYEFNPPHIHTGIISFVIWMHIPYDLNKELEVYKEANYSVTSMFGCIHSDMLGSPSVAYIPVDKKYEGVICFFPSRLIHFVNPFYTSNNYRISISGNMCLTTTQRSIK